MIVPMRLDPCRTVALLLAATALVACSRELPMDGVRSRVRELVEDQVGAQVRYVTCPGPRPLKTGDSFDCQVEIDQGTTTVTVTQADAYGRIEMKMPQHVLKVGEMERLIAENIRQNTGKTATLDCGAKFRPSIPNETFDCTARAGTDSAIVRVTVKDSEGHVTFATVPGLAAPGSGPATAAR
jgi:hypothetical protein